MGEDGYEKHDLKQTREFEIHPSSQCCDMTATVVINRSRYLKRF